MKLTDNQINKLKPGMHADGDGLYIRVRATGKKSWVKRIQTDAKDSWKTLGDYPQITLAEARRINRGVEGAVVSTTEAVKIYVSKLRVKRPELISDNYMKGLPDKPVATLTRRELVAILQKKAEKHPVAANRKLTQWKDFLNFCAQQGWVEVNVLAGVQRRFIGGKETPRSRVLSWGEIKELIHNPPIAHFDILWLILATGLRASEALWVSKHKQTVGIPTKNRQHALPHSHLVSLILRHVQDTYSVTTSLSNALLAKGVGWTPHDLRRTFATRLSDLGVMPHVIEKMLNHKMVGVMAVYNHAEYWPERHAAQRVWDKKLIELWRSGR